MMKHALTLLLCLVWSLSAVAQNTIDSIRKEYQGVKEWIALMSENFPSDGIPPEYYELRVAQNLAGSGPHHENIRMYYGELASDEEGDPYPPHFLRFATAEYNFAAREYHEEYLFDDKKPPFRKSTPAPPSPTSTLTKPLVASTAPYACSECSKA